MAIHHETAEAASHAVSALDDKKGIDITVLDVSSVIVITDVFIIASGTSRRHVMSLAEEVEVRLVEHAGRRPLRREGMEDATWVLLDFGDIVVHVFDEETRDYYDLARLWADAPRLEVAVG